MRAEERASWLGSLSRLNTHTCRGLGRVSRIWAIRDVLRRRWRARFLLACASLSPFPPLPLFLACACFAYAAARTRKKTHRARRPGACAWVFFSPYKERGRHRIHPICKIPGRPTLLFFVRKKKLCEMHLHARPRKNSLFCISPWESNWNNYFLRADERAGTLGKNLNPSGKKISAMGDFFSACNNRRSLATMRFGNWTFHCLTRGYHVYQFFFPNPPPITREKNVEQMPNG